MLEGLNFAHGMTTWWRKILTQGGALPSMQGKVPLWLMMLICILLGFMRSMDSLCFRNVSYYYYYFFSVFSSSHEPLN